MHFGGFRNVSARSWRYLFCSIVKTVIVDSPLFHYSSFVWTICIPFFNGFFASGFGFATSMAVLADNLDVDCGVPHWVFEVKNTWNPVAFTSIRHHISTS
jgi:hypothetical protein